MKLDAVHTRVDVDYEIEILKEHAKILASGAEFKNAFNTYWT